MRYLKKYKLYKEGLNDTYFKNMLINMVLSKEELTSNREEIQQKMIDRAKHNLNNNPSEDKIKEWLEDINNVIEKFIRTDGKFTIEPGDFNYTSPERKSNTNIFKNVLRKSKYIKDIVEDMPEYYLKEVGYETIINFINKEEKTMMFKPDVSISTNRNDEEDELSYILRKHKKEEWTAIRDLLKLHLIRRLAANIPEDKILTYQEAENYISVYIEKFLYQYLVPMSKI